MLRKVFYSTEILKYIAKIFYLILLSFSGRNMFTAEEYLILVVCIVALVTNKFKLTVALWKTSFFVFNTENPKTAALTLEFAQS